MKKLWVVARKDIKEAFRSRSTYFFIVFMFVISFSYYASYNSAITNFINENPGATQQQIVNASRDVLSVLAYILPMIYSIFVCSIFAAYSVIVDKAKHNIESLMVTPLSIKQIWMGKSLAVALPSVIIGIAISILGYIVQTYISVMPRTNTFIFPDWLAIFTGLILVPVLVFTVVAIVIYVQFVFSNPRIANLVFFAIFFILLFGSNILINLGMAVSFAFVYLAVIALCILIAYLLSRSLTKERVILSSKG